MSVYKICLFTVLLVVSTCGYSKPVDGKFESCPQPCKTIEDLKQGDTFTVYAECPYDTFFEVKVFATSNKNSNDKVQYSTMHKNPIPEITNWFERFIHSQATLKQTYYVKTDTDSKVAVNISCKQKGRNQ